MRASLAPLLLILVPLASASCGKPAPLDPSLAPEEVVTQLLDDAEEILLAEWDWIQASAEVWRKDGALFPMAAAEHLEPLYDDFRAFAIRARDPEMDRELSRLVGEPVEGALGFLLLSYIVHSLLPLAEELDSTETAGLWSINISAVSAPDDQEAKVAEVSVRLQRPGSEKDLVGLHFELRRLTEGWRVFRLSLSDMFARRFDLEAVVDRTAWRIRRDGDELATTSFREISLVVHSLLPERRIGFRSGPDLPADAQAIRSWLDADPASIDLRLTPGDGCTIQDVYHAVDALLGAGVTHLSLVTAAS